MELIEALRAVTERRDLSAADMQDVMQRIMTGVATPAQIGGFLVGLRMKGETVDEIAAAARVMRALATPIPLLVDGDVVDTCGTGGDGARTFNISTASAVVAAAAGVKVAKHGNRSVSGSTGSADVLEAAGVRLELSPEQVAACIEAVGVGFLFAPQWHSAMRHAVGPRREMGVRTVFNLLGPLTNPARAARQVLGVYAAEWVEPLAHVLHALGSRHVLVVHAEDGLDEISVGATTQVAELKHGAVRRYAITPQQFGLSPHPVTALQVAGPAESLARIHEALANTAGPARDIVALNAGAAIYVAGRAATLADGVLHARQVLASGAARAKLDEWAAYTQGYAV